MSLIVDSVNWKTHHWGQSRGYQYRGSDIEWAERVFQVIHLCSLFGFYLQLTWQARATWDSGLVQSLTMFVQSASVLSHCSIYHSVGWLHLPIELVALSSSMSLGFALIYIGRHVIMMSSVTRAFGCTFLLIPKLADMIFQLNSNSKDKIYAWVEDKVRHAPIPVALFKLNL